MLKGTANVFASVIEDDGPHTLTGLIYNAREDIKDFSDRSDVFVVPLKICR